MTKEQASAEMLALLMDYPNADGAEVACDIAVFGDDSDACDGARNLKGENIGGFCWEHRRRALLDRITEGTERPAAREAELFAKLDQSARSGAFPPNADGSKWWIIS